ncbi:MAG: hypothetical protein A2077_02925 [Nitrospirae bacterium GWC2_46_6]|nr:MAG: hypothetical protein A2077_02925 [Nitrospirae bacterium GWC2_46_6]OGW21707.1 MAG: hypothetical protein A2Z82_03655 [Nitrospirae bacterium GWA2_46_11]OGW23619.1 MAG: hypothetical protein A2X55_03290 [Nitrospirae bacterium GWB2_47_37]HAK88114.1 hypothetical protein [Nitrospiraceae bacterium]HCZ12915.1 hypothetical protein [Nitrospiraceae bacterium]
MINRLFKWKEVKDYRMDCPECGRKMPVKDRNENDNNGYREIRRTYECKKCRKEYGSLELIAAGKEIDSFLTAISTLNNSMGDFYEALKKLLDASKKMSGSKNAATHNTYSMN